MDREVFDTLHKWAIEQCRFGQTPTNLAHEIVDALDKGGFTVMPKEPTQKIITAMCVTDPGQPPDEDYSDDFASAYRRAVAAV